MTVSYAEYADAAERLTERVIGLEATLALCVEALDAVEWVDVPHYSGLKTCLWCKAKWNRYMHDVGKHRDDCSHEVALRAAKGE